MKYFHISLICNLGLALITSPGFYLILAPYGPHINFYNQYFVMSAVTGCVFQKAELEEVGAFPPVADEVESVYWQWLESSSDSVK